MLYRLTASATRRFRSIMFRWIYKPIHRPCHGKGIEIQTLDLGIATFILLPYTNLTIITLSSDHVASPPVNELQSIMHYQRLVPAVTLALYNRSSMAGVVPVNMTELSSRQVPANGIAIADRATAASCTGSTGCCIPSCQYRISGIQGCTGSQEAATSCDEQLYTNNCASPFAIDMCGGYLDITAACDGRAPGLQLRGAGSTGFYDKVEYQWTVGSCDIPSEGGTQCAPSTGCTTTEGHLGPDGS